MGEVSDEDTDEAEAVTVLFRDEAVDSVVGGAVAMVLLVSGD